MRRYFCWMLALSLFLSASLITGATPSSGTSPKSTVEDLLNLLPESDIVGVIDMPRASRELLPLLKGIDAAGLSGLATDFEEFAGLAALDPAKVSAAVLGVKLDGIKVRGGALLAEGLDLDPKVIEAAATKKQWKFQAIDQQTRPIYRIERIRPSADAAVPAKSDELYFAPLGAKRVVAGDLASVRSALGNASTPAAASTRNLTLQAALKQTGAASLARFALVLPEDLRQVLDGQGDLFKQLAAVKVIFGTLDLTSDQSAALNAMLSTNSKDEAMQMETSLKSLLALGKSFLGGDQNGQIAKLLDQVQIGTKESDVSLSLVIPKPLLDQLTKVASPK